MTITPRPGNSLTDLEAGGRRDHREAQGRRADRGGDPEGDGRRGAWRSSAASSRTSARRMRLSDGAGFHGDPGYFRTEYTKGQSVTAADVKRVANKYLTKGRVVLSIVPMGKLDQASKPGESKKVTDEPRRRPVRRRGDEAASEFSSIAVVTAVLLVIAMAGRRLTSAPGRRSIERRRRRPGKTPELRVPTWTKSALANGADLIVSEKHDLPARVVQPHVPRRLQSVRAGRADRPRQHDGGDDERGHQDAAMARRSRTRCNCWAHRCRPRSAARAARSASSRRPASSPRRSTSWPTCCSTRRFRPTRSNGCGRSAWLR